jgi:hypothetical protein
MDRLKDTIASSMLPLPLHSPPYHQHHCHHHHREAHPGCVVLIAVVNALSLIWCQRCCHHQRFRHRCCFRCHPCHPRCHFFQAPFVDCFLCSPPSLPLLLSLSPPPPPLLMLSPLPLLLPSPLLTPSYPLRGKTCCTFDCNT